MGWINSKWFNKSGDEPKFKVGDEVYYEVPWAFFDKWLHNTYLQPVKIVEVSKEKRGLIFEEYVYKVQVNDNTWYSDIYESELHADISEVD